MKTDFPVYNVRKLHHEAFSELAQAFDAFIESVNNTPDIKARNDFGNDHFSYDCTAFYDAMQTYRVKNHIERGIK